MRESGRRIADYALVGDLQTAALITRDGSVEWLCLPNFDSGACFAAMLGGPENGRWALAPTDKEARPTRAYRDDSLILETTWQTSEGTAVVTDFMPPRGESADMVRIVECRHGTVEFAMSLRLRFDYGSVRPWVRSWDDNHASTLAAIAGPDAVWLRSSTPVHDRESDLHSTFTLSAGERAQFVLTYNPSHLDRPKEADPDTSLQDTELFWNNWIGNCTYDGRWAAEVRRALVFLRALTFAPTGGIVAAATMSLPEELGGVRNWDYRYCWIRDATFTLQALLGTGFEDEAKAWREWLVRAVAGDPSKLQIMYGLDGSRRLPELELPWLDGFDGSKPVRIGNLAADQFQLDVWGEVLDGLHLAREAGLEMYDPAWEVQREILDWLEGHWDAPDNGLWEMRGPRRQFVHSKVMAWAGVDRAVHTVEEHGLEGPVDQWRSLRAQIHDEVCRQGYDADRGTFTQFYGSRGLDASLLLIPRVGFLPWTDERSMGTVDAVQRELMRDGYLLRYDPTADGGPDGLPGTEGAFLACSFWLVDALQATGRRDEATQLFERLLALRNDVGMLSEEVDPGTGDHLGNTPQAFSLVGLVNSARSLEGSHTSTNASHREQRISTGSKR